jgi:hypothetical protein
MRSLKLDPRNGNVYAHEFGALQCGKWLENTGLVGAATDMSLVQVQLQAAAVPKESAEICVLFLSYHSHSNVTSKCRFRAIANLQQVQIYWRIFLSFYFFYHTS